MVLELVQIAISLAFPALALALERRVRAVRTVGAVLVCYAAGLVLAQVLPLGSAREVVDTAAGVFVALAIPLLLFSLDPRGFARIAPRAFLSFALCVASVLAAGFAAGLWLAAGRAGGPEAVGMLMGVYTGGTPNMAAIGVALRVPPETFVTLNAADIVVSAFYLPFLLAVAPRLYARILPPFAARGARQEGVEDQRKPTSWGDRLGGLALSALVVVVGGGFGAYLAPEGFGEAGMVLGITTVAIAASFIPAVRAWPGTASSGRYLLLAFCVAVGWSADFGHLWSGGGRLLAMTAFVMLGASLLHLLLAALLRVDRDTTIITNTASIFGPAFIAPVAEALRNRESMLPGLATGLLGYAIGNYLGIGMAWWLKTWLG